MLDLDLCRRLKDKGFPQDNPSAVWDFDMGDGWSRAPSEEMYEWKIWKSLKCDGGYLNYTQWEEPSKDALRIPDINELLAELVKLGYDPLVNRLPHLENPWHSAAVHGTAEIHRYCDSPVAALAELWIALKEARDGEK